MSFEMTEVGEPLSNEDIDSLERKLGVTLPADYKAFLRKNNGGRPNPPFFPIEGLENNPYGAIQVFLGDRSHISSNNIEWNSKTLSKRMPEHLFPIARTGMGDILCLSLRGSDKDAVYFWDHRNEQIPPSYDNLHLVAETFSKFLDSIHSRDLSADVAKVKGKLIKGPQ
jgi:hypothetical protein